jgi:hypothetical protein
MAHPVGTCAIGRPDDPMARAAELILSERR